MEKILGKCTNTETTKIFKGSREKKPLKLDKSGCLATLDSERQGNNTFTVLRGSGSASRTSQASW